MKNIKKMSIIIMTFCILMTSMLSTGCQKEEKVEEQSEVITSINKQNVKNVANEYTNIIMYYESLKGNLDEIKTVRKNLGPTATAVKVKADLKNTLNDLQDLNLKYDKLDISRELLVQLYALSMDMADNVLEDPKNYESKKQDYDNLFPTFKENMDKIKKEIDKVNGVESKIKDKEIETVDKEKIEKEKTDQKDKTEEKNEKEENTQDEESKKDEPKKDESNKEESNNAYELTETLKQQVRNAGIAFGSEYKTQGNAQGALESEANKRFEEILQDGPIESSQVEQARTLFLEGARSGYGN